MLSKEGNTLKENLQFSFSFFFSTQFTKATIGHPGYLQVTRHEMQSIKNFQ